MNRPNSLILFLSYFLVGFLTHAGVGGAGGGVGKMDIEYTELRVCESGYEGPSGLCSTIRLKTSKYLEQQKALQMGASAECYRYQGEIEVRVPCDEEIIYKIPDFLLKLNEAFKNENNLAPVVNGLYGN